MFEIVMFQIVRREYSLSFRSNAYLSLAIATAFIAQLTVLYTPAAEWFEVVPIGVTEGELIGLALVVFWVVITGY